jgi:hypothetical protein
MSAVKVPTHSFTCVASPDLLSIAEVPILSFTSGQPNPHFLFMVVQWCCSVQEEQAKADAAEGCTPDRVLQVIITCVRVVCIASNA